MKEKRIPAHVVETKARDYIRSQINNFYKNGDALFRELTERDYGIDAVIELFDNGIPTGKFALLQIKGTEKTIQPLRKFNCVSCKISASNALYALQNNIPVMLIYVTLSKPRGFYFTNIHDALQGSQNKLHLQKNITLRIPIQNNALENLTPFFESIRQFYEKKES